MSYTDLSPGFAPPSAGRDSRAIYAEFETARAAEQAGRCPRCGVPFRQVAPKEILACLEHPVTRAAARLGDFEVPDARGGRYVVAVFG